MRFDRYLNGMLELEADAKHTETILQLFTGEGIYVYQVKRQGDLVWFTIHLDDFSAMRHLFRQHGIRFHIKKREGLPFAISRLKRRRGLLLGMALGFAILYLLLSFIWDYEVYGNQYHSDAHMIALVQEYGVIPGSRSDKFDYDELAKQMVLDHPEFTWIQLKPDGTTLHITVKEQLPNTEDVQKTGSLVARTSGRITELLVFRGTALVQRGDWVTKGQVLVGGWDYPDRQKNEAGGFEPAGPPYAVEAHAVISGEQERKATGSCALEEQILVSTGREKTQMALICKGHQLIIRGPKESPYRYAEQHTGQHSLVQWKTFQLPVYLKTTVFTEKEVRQKQYTEQQAYDIAVERARTQLQEQLPDGSRFIHESIGFGKTGQNIMQAEVVWLVEEPLAEKQQITLPEAQNYEKAKDD